MHIMHWDNVYYQILDYKWKLPLFQKYKNMRGPALSGTVKGQK